uniref:Uncharacterized protein n=1 Tax=Magallana gigas TaxID=29159 RepID=K1QV33_MAGGI
MRRETVHYSVSFSHSTHRTQKKFTQQGNVAPCPQFILACPRTLKRRLMPTSVDNTRPIASPTWILSF